VDVGRTNNGTLVVETGNDGFRLSWILSECRQEEIVFVLRATNFAFTTMLWLSSVHRRGMKASKTQVSYCWPASLPRQESEEDPLTGSVLSAEGGERNAVSTSTITCLYNRLKI
jgi:hypothetical protein